MQTLVISEFRIWEKFVSFLCFFALDSKGVPGLRCGIPSGGPGILLHWFWGRVVSVWVLPGSLPGLLLDDCWCPLVYIIGYIIGYVFARITIRESTFEQVLLAYHSRKHEAPTLKHKFTKHQCPSCTVNSTQGQLRCGRCCVESEPFASTTRADPRLTFCQSGCWATPRFPQLAFWHWRSPQCANERRGCRRSCVFCCFWQKCNRTKVQISCLVYCNKLYMNLGLIRSGLVLIILNDKVN